MTTLNDDSTLPGIDRQRRRLLAAAGIGLGMGMSASVTVRAAETVPETLTAAINAYTGGAPVTPGRVVFDIAGLVDNGNTVPISITVDSPMTAASHVTAIAVFNERNPQRDVARFTLGPRAGRAHVSARIRLATSQKLVAVARMNDGTFWSQSADVIVTLAACIEGD
ncbi:MAG: SoxY-related AACIE arm protein [Herminiimonas sp.]|nr:SoxY-related AACIE arm protein [Herminiimonas sp.]